MRAKTIALLAILLSALVVTPQFPRPHVTAQQSRQDMPHASAAEAKSEGSPRLNLTKEYVDAILDFITRYYVASPPGFTARRRGDILANATYYGAVATWLLGGLPSLANFSRMNETLTYLYDSDSGMFRDWFGGHPCVEATAYSLALMRMFNLSFEEFNATRTVVALLNWTSTHANNATLGELAHAIIALVLASEALSRCNVSANITSVLKMNVSAAISLLACRLWEFYSNGSFYDERSPLTRLEQTYLAACAVAVVNASELEAHASEIAEYVMSLAYKGNESALVGGFGEGEQPDVRTTGLALSLLSLVGEINESVLENSTQFLLRCVDVNESAILVRPNGTEAGFYDAVWLVLGLHAAGVLAKAYNVTYLTDLQLHVWMNATWVRVNLTLYGRLIPHARGVCELPAPNITTQLRYSAKIRAYVFKVSPSLLGFGAYTIKLLFELGGLFTPTVTLVNTTTLRVGYDISMTLEYSGAHPRPGSNVTVRVEVSYNGTPVDSGTLVIEIERVERQACVMREEFDLSLTPGRANFTWNIPSDAPLGKYVVRALVNDTHGWNHTVRERVLDVLDLLRVEVRGNESIYHVGDTVNVSANITYQGSGGEVPLNDAVKVRVIFGLWPAWVWFEFTWFPNGTVQNKSVNWVKVNVCENVFTFTVRLPPTLPQHNVTVDIYVTFDRWTTRGTKMFNFTLNVSDIRAFVSSDVSYIGSPPNLSVSVVALTTNTTLINATLLASIVGKNRTWQVLNLTYHNGTYTTDKPLDPNIPPGTYNLTLQLSVPFLRKLIDLNATARLEVRGTPITISWKLSPERPLEGDMVVIEFTVVCNETNATLTGLVMNATIEPLGVTTRPIDAGNGTYVITFVAARVATYNVTVQRISDGAVVLSVTFEVKPRPTPVVGVLERFGSLIYVGVVVVSFILWLIARRKWGAKVPRLWLMRRR